MEFSESLDFGNSTFMKLENLMKGDVNGSQCKSRERSIDSPDPPPPVDIITESPTETKSSFSRTRTFVVDKINKTQNALQRHKFQTTKNVPSRSKFSKSKSDSSLDCDNHNPVLQIDNYSAFFRSDFPIEEHHDEEVQLVKAEPSDVMRISQIQAALDNTTSDGHQICEGSVLDTALFSEDFNVVLQEEDEEGQQNTEKQTSYKEKEQAENEWQDSLLLSNKEDRKKEEEVNERIDTLPQIDETSFITSGREEAQRISALELKRSKCTVDQVFEEAYHPLKKKKKSNKAVLSAGSPSSSMRYLNEISKTAVNQSHSENAETGVDILGDNREALKQISAWHLPLSIQREYEKKGIRTMFDWQIECLSNPKVLFEHKNLVYSAPTSAGKTLISEILLIKTVVERFKKVLLILPFISVVREKMFYLQDLLLPSGYRVEGFFGGYSPPGGFESINVAICTIEKANTIVNKLLEQKKLADIGLIIVDEVHLISDPGRGYILELLLAKVLYMCRQFGFQIQIITMSATLANVTLLQRWLQAECYITHFRPVALQEMIKVGSTIYDKDMKLLRELNTADGGFEVLQNDAEHVAQLCIETLDASCSVLVFCPSKDWCEKLALQLAGAIYSVGKGSGELGNRLRAQLNREAINELKRQLKELPTGLDSILERTTTYGCAFHHAGLTTEERDLVEASFKSGALKVIVATSTLSSGVNLPARRVLIRSPLFGGKQMNALTYRQMIGRAGRTGKDTVGESILLCTEGNARSGRELITADLKPITSCLEMENSAHLKRALLEVISSGVASTKEDIEEFVSCTLLHTEKDIPDSREEAINREKDKPRAEAVSQCISESIEFLLEYEFIRLQSPNEDRLNMNMDMYVATRLGQACLASSMPPSDGLLLFAELQKSRRCFVLESDLHAVYLVTPYSVCYQLQDMDWLFFLDLWEKLKPAMKKVGEIVGVKESFLVRAMRGQSNLDYKLLQIHKRFYIALALQELVNETPINQVAVKYRCTRGLLQSLQQMSSTFAGIVTAFCNSLNWSTLALVVSQFKERLFFGVHHDLIDLMRLPELNQKRARALFDADITNLVQLANADVAAVEKILYNSLCFDSAKQQENENAYDAERRISERILFITGRKGLTVSEAASMLIQDARVFVQYDIGVENIHWNKVESEASMESECGDRREAKKATEEKENLACEDNIKLKQIKRKCPQEGRRRLLMSNADDEQKNEEATVTDTKLLKKSAMDLVKSKNTEKCNEKYKKLEKAQNNLPINQKHWTNISQTSSHPERPDNQQNPKVTKNAEKVNRTELLTKSIDNQEALVSTVTSMDIKKTKIPPLIHDRIPSNIKKEQHSEKSQNNIEKNLKEKTHFSTPKLQGKKDFVEETTVLLSKERFKDESQATPSGGAFMKTVPRRSPRNHIVSSTRIETVPNALLNKGKPLEKADMSTPTGNSFMKTKPRRSPRNNIVSSTRLAKMMPNGGGDGDADGGDKRISKKEEPEIFADDDYSDSFRMNTDIADALKIADEMLDSHTPCPTMDNHLNKSNDEIPSSQQCDNDDVHTQTPQKSRFLRSYCVKNRASPKPAQQQQQQQPPPNDIITVSSKNQQDSLALPLHHYDVTNDPSISTKSEDRIELSDVSMENSLMLNPQYLNASHILSCSKTDSDVGASSFKSIEIIDMCSKQKLFKEAFKELNAARRIGLSLGLQKDVNKRTPLIGSNLLITEVTEKQTAVKETVQFALDDTSSSYLAGIAFSLDKNIVYFMNMQDEGTCAGLTKELKCKYLCLLFKSTQCTFLIHDTKEQLKCLRKVLRETATAGDISLEDPKVANWLLQPDNNLSFADLTQQFAPECTALVKLCGTARGFGSVGLDADNAIFAKVRCSIEACVTSYILRGQIENLERIGSGQLMKFFKELEMPLQLSLCNMELYGFPANASELRKLFQQMVETLKKVEVKIYDMHGSRFNLTSTAAVAKVLGLHRKSNGRVSTSRQILEKIASPISQLIITHRKLSATITKNIQPLLKCITGDRIHGQSITFTATGRISMTEPNLQNVAKDFEVELGAKEKITISCRGAFSPTDAKRCLIASDFCQLEMRILAHLSQDATLLEVLNSETDVFIALAARWNKISEDEVSEPLRNGTKQICYGIVYGMGIRSLAEALKCTEEEAANVSQQFHAAYPGIKIFTERVVKFAHTNGYIETITGRRRYLQHINSSESNIRKQAERQAINSTIQGSAADIAKSAIIRMEKNIIKYSKKLGIDPTSNVHLVLHLHDELIYEVPTEKAKKIAKVLSVTMENCVKLSVPLRVKLKIGKTWGDLKEVKL